MSILDGYATSEERDYDDAIEAHRNGDCFEDDCPVCIEEAYQRDMWERRKEKKRCQCGHTKDQHGYTGTFEEPGQLVCVIDRCNCMEFAESKKTADAIMAKFDGLVELFKK